MLRSSRLAVPAALLALLALQPCVIAQAQEWKTFTDPDGRFSVSCPAEWTTLSRTDDPAQQTFVICKDGITAVTDEVKLGLSLILVPDPNAGAIKGEALLELARQVRQQVGQASAAQGEPVAWEEFGTTQWAGLPAVSSRGHVAGAGGVSEAELRVLAAERFVVIAACSWPQGEIDGTLAKVRDSLRLTAAPESPANRPQTQRTAGIVFVRFNPGEDAGSELWLLEPGKPAPVQLTHLNRAGAPPVYVHYPAWSPDRSRIAFSSDYNAERSAYPVNIFTIDAGGGDMRQLTFAPSDGGPAPAGPRAIVIGQVLQPGAPEGAQGFPFPNVRVSAGGTDATTLTDAQGRFRLEGVPVGENWVKLWAPKDKATWGFAGENPSMLVWPKLTAGGVNDLGSIRMSNAPGSFLCTTSLTEPCWAEGGARIVFTRRSEYQGELGKPHLMMLNDPEWVERRGRTDPEKLSPWAPTTEFTGGVAYVFPRSQLMSIATDRSSLQVLTGAFFSDGAFPTALPGSDRLLFKLWPFDAKTAGTSGPFAFQGQATLISARLSAEDLQAQVMPSPTERHSGLAVSPDGRFVAYVKRGELGNPEQATAWGPIAMADLQTGQERVVVQSAQAYMVVTDLDFSPDGKSLVFAATPASAVPFDYYDTPLRAGNLYIADIQTGQTIQVTNDNCSLMPTWTQ